MVLLSPTEQTVALQSKLGQPFYRDKVVVLKGSLLVRPSECIRPTAGASSRLRHGAAARATKQSADDRQRAGVDHVRAAFLFPDRKATDLEYADQQNVLRAWAIRNSSLDVPIYALALTPAALVRARRWSARPLLASTRTRRSQPAAHAPPCAGRALAMHHAGHLLVSSERGTPVQKTARPLNPVRARPLLLTREPRAARARSGAAGVQLLAPR